MLQAAQQRKAEGVDAWPGYIEPHGRRETEVLLEGRRAIAGQVDTTARRLAARTRPSSARLARKPQLLLVDELAHSNPAGSCTPSAGRTSRSCAPPASTPTPP